MTQESVSPSKNNGTESVPMREAVEITQAGKPVGFLSKLAKPQNMLSASIESLTRISTNKPKKDVYIRVHPDYFQDLISVIDKSGMESTTYVMAGEVVQQALGEEAIESMLQNRRYFLYVTQGGSYGLWGITLPMDDEGRELNSWTESALRVINQAQGKWLRHYAKRGDGSYRVIPATKDLGDPKWPSESWEEILELAFKDKFIEDINHPYFEKLRGNLS
jgi:hypothetical protein